VISAPGVAVLLEAVEDQVDGEVEAIVAVILQQAGPRDD
jgi:hypothetical protein